MNYIIAGSNNTTCGSFFYREPNEREAPYSNKKLRSLCLAKLDELFKDNEACKERFEYEFALVKKDNIAFDILVLQQIVMFSNEMGQAVLLSDGICNSFILYLLGVSEINPMEYHLDADLFFKVYNQKELSIAVSQKVIDGIGYRIMNAYPIYEHNMVFKRIGLPVFEMKKAQNMHDNIDFKAMAEKVVKKTIQDKEEDEEISETLCQDFIHRKYKNLYDFARACCYFRYTEIDDKKMSDLDDEHCFTNCDELAKILKAHGVEEDAIPALIDSALRNKNKEIFLKALRDRYIPEVYIERYQKVQDMKPLSHRLNILLEEFGTDF